ncbi:protein with EF-hand domain [Klebsormidium nitens]|uniref:Protein with EF-hand domain n=1 Tax=Klebsormidium nitens TaxID=105231 RepID=A0A0U9HKP7_KLENI|nr:protein with EF-hand domain [Klebsormidium nitens]|eukprot:GAQ89886.1 protein with EF-hand domain [Klebsormidium nitens]
MDFDHSGTITLDELQYALKQQGSWLVESEVQALLDAADIDHDGTIDYDEFIAATMHFCQLEKEEHLLKAFHSFDHDNNGYITKEELEKAIQVIGLDTTEDGSAEDIIKVADEDNDGVIDYKEFQTMMRRTSSQASRASKSEGVPSPLPSPSRTEQNGTGFGKR